MWQSSGGRFRRVLLCKGTGGGSTMAPSSSKLSDSVSLVSHSRLNFTLRWCAIRVFLQQCQTASQVQILYVARYSVHQDGLWTNYFGHPIFAEFLPILRHLEPHVIPNLVIAASGTWRLPLYLEGDALALNMEMKEEDQNDISLIEIRLKEAFMDGTFMAYRKLTMIVSPTGLVQLGNKGIVKCAAISINEPDFTATFNHRCRAWTVAWKWSEGRTLEALDNRVAEYLAAAEIRRTMNRISAHGWAMAGLCHTKRRN